MKDVIIGAQRFRIVAVDRAGGGWLARAERADTGDPYGLEYSGGSEHEAVGRVVAWLEWQAEHAAALDALQEAERAYHRTIAGSAFASAIEGPSAIEMQKESLELVEAARVRLDDIRARKPE